MKVTRIRIVGLEDETLYDLWMRQVDEGFSIDLANQFPDLDTAQNHWLLKAMKIEVTYDEVDSVTSLADEFNVPIHVIASFIGFGKYFPEEQIFTVMETLPKEAVKKIREDWAKR